MTNQTQIPAGFRKDSKGRLVPEDMVKPIDKTRDELVNNLFEIATKQHFGLKTFKHICFDEISAFVGLSAEQYGAKLGGQKGNVTLYSFDGSLKIQLSVQENIVFDERLQAAKALIDDCINEWVQGSRSEIAAIINDAFRVDKKGEISIGRITGLRRLDITEQRWLDAMQAISDSIQVAGSKSYVRFYKRVGDTDQYKPLSLDIASI